MFFQPGNWDKSSSEVLQFKRSNEKSNNEGIATTAKRKKDKKNKKKKTKNSTDSGVTASVANKKQNQKKSEGEAIKQGRVEKLTGKKQRDPKNNQQQKVSPAKKKILLKEVGALPQKTKAELDEEKKVDGNPESSAKSSLKERLQEQLMGGRFRFINEQLYTMDSTDAVRLFQEDKNAFNAYHAGYRHQVEKWPMNPLKRIIKTIRRLPKSLVVGDFGCGEGKLAQSVVNKVYSMDLVSCRADIIACDMSHTPIESQTLDVAVYCLSLMGTNLKDYLLEANRVLKINGIVLIAEIQSRFEDIREFVRFMAACGFELSKKDTNTKVFYFFEFKKTRNVGKVAIIPDYELKPCLYRKR